MLLQFLVGDGAAGDIFFADGDHTFGGLEVVEAVDLAGLPSAVTSTSLLVTRTLVSELENWSSFALSMSWCLLY